MKKREVPFCKWVTTMLAKYMQWNEETRSQNPSREKRPSSQQRNRSAAGKSVAQHDRGAGSAKSSDTQHPRLPYLKSVSPDHSLRRCPVVNPGRLKLSLLRCESANARAIRMLMPASGVNPGDSSSEHAASSAGYILVTMDGFEMQATLLDSGVDNSLLSWVLWSPYKSYDPTNLFITGLKDAVAWGLSERGLRQIETSLERYADNFRDQFGLDQPINVESVKIRLMPIANYAKCKFTLYCIAFSSKLTSRRFSTRC
ncbi:hypothetical protein GQ600_17613 [Phytophthora cactorum]|nr:hypothetical protein GQ600_17613 [Phytophthora cactorum]